MEPFSTEAAITPHAHTLTEKRATDRTLETNRYQCGCAVFREHPGADGRHIHYCTMHAQAPAMLEALAEFSTATKAEVVLQNGRGESVAASLSLADERARALLAQIEKED